MRTDTSTTLTSSQANSFVGALPTNYITSLIPNNQTSIFNQSKDSGTVDIKTQLQEAESNLLGTIFECEYLQSSLKPDTNIRSINREILPAIVKYASLLNYQNALKKWHTYVNSLYRELESEGVGFTQNVLDSAKQFLDVLVEYFRTDFLFLEIPDACPGESKNFMFLWDNGVHYLECEIFDNGAVEFFYKNRSTDEIWGEDTRINAKLTPEIANKLMLFVSTER